MIVLILVVAGIGAWQVIQSAFTTRDALQAAKTDLASVSTAYQNDDRARAQSAFESASQQADAARDATQNFWWSAAEAVPGVGSNLVAVRTVANQTSGLLDGAGGTVRLVLSLDPNELASGGAVNVQTISSILNQLPSLDDRLSQARDALDAIETDGLIDQISEGVTQLRDQVDELQPGVQQATALGQYLPGLLGGDGPKNYLMLFQNNAEVRGLGGNPASLLLLHVDDGRLTIADQKSSSDFRAARATPIAALPDGAYSVFVPNVSRFEMDMTGFPDFPAVAQLAQGWWRDAGGKDRIDGVLAFDPVGLSYLLRATGPVTLPDGDTLTSDNVVKKVLSDVYSKYPIPQMQDAYFAAAASSVFDALTKQKVDSGQLLNALGQSITERRLLFWSADDGVQNVLSVSSQLQGVIPADGSGSDSSTNVGVYLWDTTGSKIDYHVTNANTARRFTCSATNTTTYTVDVTLTSTVSPAEAQRLPAYVLPNGPKSAARFGTDIYVFGPSASRFTGMQVIEGGLSQNVAQQGETLGRPGVRVATQMAFGTTTTVRLTFTADGVQDTSSLNLLSTPQVHAAKDAVETREECL